MWFYSFNRNLILFDSIGITTTNGVNENSETTASFDASQNKMATDQLSHSTTNYDTSYNTNKYHIATGLTSGLSTTFLSPTRFITDSYADTGIIIIYCN